MKQTTLTRWDLTWRRLPAVVGACVLGAFFLAGCGGSPEVLVTNIPASNASDPVLPSPPATSLGGLYKGEFDSYPNHEFLALVVPAVGQNVQVFGWYYGATDPNLAHLYSGQLALGSQGVAANVPQSWRVSEGADPHPYPATVNITNGSLNGLTANLAINRGGNTNYRLVANSLASTAYNFNAAPTTLNGTRWTGFWSSKASILAGDLAFGSDGTTTVPATAWSCFSGNPAPPLSWTWTAQSQNFFKVVLTLGSINSCDWEHQSLEGVAVVSTQNNHIQLDMMLLDGNGAGISYRGTPN